MKGRTTVDGTAMPSVKDSVDLETASETELLHYVSLYLERVRAHHRLGWAVRRAARRLELAKGGDGHAVATNAS
jgi:hypothetical protein